MLDLPGRRIFGRWWVNALWTAMIDFLVFVAYVRTSSAHSQCQAHTSSTRIQFDLPDSTWRMGSLNRLLVTLPFIEADIFLPILLWPTFGRDANKYVLYIASPSSSKVWVHPCVITDLLLSSWCNLTDEKPQSCTLVAHQDCLLQWIKESQSQPSRRENALKCPQCNTKYIVVNWVFRHELTNYVL